MLKNNYTQVELEALIAEMKSEGEAASVLRQQSVQRMTELANKAIQHLDNMEAILDADGNQFRDSTQSDSQGSH